MASVSAEIEIAAAPEKVWAVMMDPAQFSAWIDNHQGFIGEPPTALAPGMAFGQRMRVMGMPAELRWTVDGLEEPRRLVLQGVGPMGINLTATQQLNASDAGTAVSMTYEFKGAAVFAVAGQLQREVGDSLRTSLAKLKSLLES
ncbi:MAG: SRPBCC family protein [Kineosporiaceae bacterium]|nr:SRPBCC family protein [Kineosporiaceae bacterium]MBK7623026.1 SRPBCC family protein [Kineosporiaceae bacterium]MBK8075027.1 SRPBCC family protein [Kineosporiaceae bacterium]